MNNMLIGSEDPAVYGNAYDVANDLCKRYSIGHIITLTPEYEEYCIGGVMRYHIPMYGIPMRYAISDIFNIIDNALSKREAAWVHCKQGIDRTGCVIGAYLVKNGHDPDVVIKDLLSKFDKRLQHLPWRKLWKDKADFIKEFAPRNRDTLKKDT